MNEEGFRKWKGKETHTHTHTNIYIYKQGKWVTEVAICVIWLIFPPPTYGV